MKRALVKNLLCSHFTIKKTEDKFSGVCCISRYTNWSFSLELDLWQLKFVVYIFITECDCMSANFQKRYIIMFTIFVYHLTKVWRKNSTVKNTDIIFVRLKFLQQKENGEKLCTQIWNNIPTAKVLQNFLNNDFELSRHYIYPC